MEAAVRTVVVFGVDDVAAVVVVEGLTEGDVVSSLCTVRTDSNSSFATSVEACGGTSLTVCLLRK